MNSRVIYLMLAAFFGICGYGFTRTSAAPFFNEAYGPEYLSWAMIASAALAILAVAVYNQLAKKFALIPLCIGAMVFSIIVMIFFGFVMGHHPKWLALIYYAWSDVYILILVEQFWSISNTLFHKNEAKKYYGILLAAGSIGGLVGNGLVTILAERLGADNMIFFAAISIGLFIGFIYLLKRSIDSRAELKKRFEIEHDIADHSQFGGASLVFKSRYITLLALLVLATQLYINGAYFYYNQNMVTLYNTVNTQSAFYAKIFFIIQVITIFFSLAITPSALKFLGVAKTHYSIVTIMIAIFIAILIAPTLAIAATLFIAAKAFDYSTFRAAKELFYLPLHVAEKFQAKAFIDVFLYRFSKAIAAAGIIIVGLLDISVLYLIGFGLILWFILIVLILKLYHKKESTLLKK